MADSRLGIAQDGLPIVLVGNGGGDCMNEAPAIESVGKMTRAVRVRVTLRGMTPLLGDTMCDGELKDSVEDGETIVMPAANILACFRDGGRHVKVTARKRVSTQRSSLVSDCVEIDGGEYVPLTHNGWVRDVRRGVGKTGDANGIVLPKFKDWKLTMTLRVRERAPFTLKTFREVVETAGIFAGLGCFRPKYFGCYGRFEIAAWDELGEVQAE